MKFPLSSVLNKILRNLLPKADRRSFIRLNTHNLIRYRAVGNGAGLSFSRNISAGGVLFFCPEELSAGSIVEMEINFPHFPEPIRAVAKVVRVSPNKYTQGFEIGVEFIEVDEEAKNFINQKILSVQTGSEPEAFNDKTSKS